MVSITPRVSYMERAEWDNSGQPRLGYTVARSVRTELIVHHTVAIDNDASPLVWETDAEVINHMRVLRTIRPDLDLDVPYNFVAFMRPNLTLTVCEGRGLDRTGAHTHAHNTSGVATSMAGDFHNYPLGDFLSPFVLALNDWFHWQKGQLPNLQVINGHRDYNGTACPGQHLYATKGGWTWEQEGDMDANQAAQLDTVFHILTDSQEPNVPRWAWFVNFIGAIRERVDQNHTMLFGDVTGDATTDKRRLIGIGQMVKKITAPTAPTLSAADIDAIAVAVANKLDIKID